MQIGGIKQLHDETTKTDVLEHCFDEEDDSRKYWPFFDLFGLVYSANFFFPPTCSSVTFLTVLRFFVISELTDHKEIGHMIMNMLSVNTAKEKKSRLQKIGNYCLAELKKILVG
jgi:hypothetical protein